MNTTKCKIPIGCFYGHLIMLPGEDYAEKHTNLTNYPDPQVQSSFIFPSNSVRITSIHNSHPLTCKQQVLIRREARSTTHSTPGWTESPLRNQMNPLTPLCRSLLHTMLKEARHTWTYPSVLCSPHLVQVMCLCRVSWVC